MANKSAIIEFDPKLKEAFFDRPKVMAVMDKSSQKTLFWFGGQTRKRIRSYIGKPNVAGDINPKTGAPIKRRKPRPPGRPPISRVADSSRNSLRNIQFFVKRPESNLFGRVVVASIKFPGGETHAGKTAPELQEFGGTIKVKASERTKKTKSGRPSKRKGQVQKYFVFGYGALRSFKLPARPFMGPPFVKMVKRDLPRRMRGGGRIG